VENDVKALIEDEFDEAMSHAIINPDFRPYLKHLGSELGEEPGTELDIEQLEAEWGTNESYEELVAFLVWKQVEAAKTQSIPTHTPQRRVTWAPEVAEITPPAEKTLAPAKSEQPRRASAVTVATASKAGFP